MPLTPSEEADLRLFCTIHDLPSHVQARSRQIAESVQEVLFSELKAEVLEAC